LLDHGLEDMQRQINMSRPSAGSKSALQTAVSGTIVRVLIANATGMSAYPVIDLAEEHDIAIVLDNRRDHGRDTSTLEWLLGPCYARLPSDPRFSSLYIGKIVSDTRIWHGQSSILVLTDADQAEPLAALARAACEPHVTVELIKKVTSSVKRGLQR
jgi:hypothetical protein